MGRKRKYKRLLTSFTVLGDGRTEQYYLKHLKDIRDYKYSIYPSLFDDINIETAEDKIDELLSGGCDRIVYFVDFDTIVNQGKQKKINELVQKYEDSPEVVICETMPCIEFWFLLHYRITTQEFRNAEEVVRLLKKNISSYTKSKKFLENSGWVNDLCSNDKLKKAKTNAAKILIQKESKKTGDHFPFTKVHLGIEIFEKQKKEAIKK